MKRTSTLFLIFALTAFASLAGCAGIQRSSSSGYNSYDSASDAPNLGRDRREAEKADAQSELGLSNKQLTDQDTDAVQLRAQVLRAEHDLQGKQEREQYFKNKAYMKNDRDRLAFLNLPSFEARQRWLNGKGIQAGAMQNAPEIQALVDNNDITVGMTKQAVRDSWGEPDLIEVAGNPIYGNERWHFSGQTSSTEGYQTQNRIVYFESGRVVGWESH
jgi:outer membrane protein assembly factor BamE (lipoprotein component of BamABCDE complex)